jgi:hypothetical protein
MARTTRKPKLPLPEGWEWVDYRIPKAENAATSARIEFLEDRQPSCEMARFGRTVVSGDVPPEVRRIFDHRNAEIGPHTGRRRADS